MRIRVFSELIAACVVTAGFFGILLQFVAMQVDAASGTDTRSSEYRLIINKENAVCQSVGKIINPPSKTSDPFSNRGKSLFKDVNWKEVDYVAARGFKSRAQIAIVNINGNSAKKVVAPFSTIFPNNTFDTWIEIAPTEILNAEMGFSLDEMEKKRIGRIGSQEITLTELKRQYPPGAFGNKRYDKPNFSTGREVTTVNDFDLLSVGDKTYLFMRTYDLDDSRHEVVARTWVIIGRIKELKIDAQSSLLKSVDLDGSLEHSCYFVLTK